MTTKLSSHDFAEKSMTNASKTLTAQPTSSTNSEQVCQRKMKKKTDTYLVFALDEVRHAVEFLRRYRDETSSHGVPIVQLMLAQHELEDMVGKNGRR